jgi:hypothetical protein
VNLSANDATLVIHAYGPGGTESAAAADVTLGARRQYTKDLTQLFGRDLGAVSLVVETSTLAVVGDVVLSDATPADRYRASIALTDKPQQSLVIPYVAGGGTVVTSLAVSNAGTTPANAKLILYAPDGSQAGSTTAKIAANGSLAGTLTTLFSKADGAYVTISADQPLTAMSLIDPHVRDVALVPGLPMPGTARGDIGPTTAPVISAPVLLEFGSVPVGQSKDLTATVGNIGSASLTVSALTANGSAFRIIGPQTPFTLPVGGSQAVTARFTPAAAGLANGTLIVSSNDPARPNATVSLAGSGVAGAPMISVSPASLAFGSVTIGQPKDLTLSIANRGTAPLAVSSMTSDNTQFTAIGTVPTVVAGSNASVTVRFTPTTASAQTGNLTIASNDAAVPALKASLTGTGVAVPSAPVIDVSPASLDYGTVNIGQNKDLNVSVTNRGTASLVVSSITSDNLQFSPVFNVLTLPVGSSAILTVRFAPSGSGPQIGNLRLASNDPRTPSLLLPAKGTGAAVTGEITLKVDGGTFNGGLGFPDGADPAVFVNRLTPPSYPATLKNVQIYFGNRANGLKAGAPIVVVAATNPSGSSNFSVISAGVLNLVPTTIGSTGTFSTYTVPETTITSGDFVVGFLVSPNPPGVYPADLDQSTPSKKQSYLSGDGFTFTLVDSYGASTTGNLGIRATVTITAAK